MHVVGIYMYMYNSMLAEVAMVFGQISSEFRARNLTLERGEQGRCMTSDLAFSHSNRSAFLDFRRSVWIVRYTTVLYSISWSLPWHIWGNGTISTSLFHGPNFMHPIVFIVQSFMKLFLICNVSVNVAGNVNTAKTPRIFMHFMEIFCDFFLVTSVHWGLMKMSIDAGKSSKTVNETLEVVYLICFRWKQINIVIYFPCSKRALPISTGCRCNSDRLVTQWKPFTRRASLPNLHPSLQCCLQNKLQREIKIFTQNSITLFFIIVASFERRSNRYLY